MRPLHKVWGFKTENPHTFSSPQGSYRVKNQIFSGLLYCALAISCFLILAPLLFGLSKAFPALGSLITDEELWFACRLSLYTSAISSAFCILLALLSSYFFFIRRLKADEEKRAPSIVLRMLELILVIPISLPHVVSGIMIALFFGGLGLGAWLKPWGINLIFSVPGIILTQIIVNLPLCMEQLRAALTNCDPRHVFLARSYGASEAQLFSSLIVPHIRYEFISTCFLCLSRALGEYGAVMIVAGSIRLKTELLPTAILLNMSTGNLTRSLAIACISLVLALCLYAGSRYLNTKLNEQAGNF